MLLPIGKNLVNLPFKILFLIVLQLQLDMISNAFKYKYIHIPPVEKVFFEAGTNTISIKFCMKSKYAFDNLKTHMQVSELSNFVSEIITVCRRFFPKYTYMWNDFPLNKHELTKRH